jgi:hypothetical protein
LSSQKWQQIYGCQIFSYQNKAGLFLSIYLVLILVFKKYKQLLRGGNELLFTLGFQDV